MMIYAQSLEYLTMYNMAMHLEDQEQQTNPSLAQPPSQNAQTHSHLLLPSI